jgi:dsRNA-specific ribonuclease
MSFTKNEDIIKTDEGLVFNPYNPNNLLIEKQDIQDILTKYGLPNQIFNEKIYKRAFVHRSYVKRPALENAQQNITIAEKPNDCLPLRSKSNERLEFLGDGILEGVAKYILYQRYPTANEGFMTSKKIEIVKNEAIGKIAMEMGLNKWLIISRNAEEMNVRTNLAKLGCLFEAFIGAIFLDFNKIQIHDNDRWFDDIFLTGPGFQMAHKFIQTVFEKHVDWASIVANNFNYKNTLQVKIQKQFRVTPHYLQLSYDSEKGYRMGVFLCIGQPIHAVNIEDALHINNYCQFSSIHQHITEHGKIFLFLGEGEHKMKKKAEQKACFEAINLLNRHNSEEHEEQEE